MWLLSCCWHSGVPYGLCPWIVSVLIETSKPIFTQNYSISYLAEPKLFHRV